MHSLSFYASTPRTLQEQRPELISAPSVGNTILQAKEDNMSRKTLEKETKEVILPDGKKVVGGVLEGTPNLHLYGRKKSVSEYNLDLTPEEVARLVASDAALEE